MPRNSKLIKNLRTIDTICKLTTGKRLSSIVSEGMQIFGEDILNKISSANQPKVDINDPYYVLGLHPDCPDFLVKAVYRQQMKQHHPDTGAVSAAMAARINQAYETICLMRGIPK
ncbi:MAG: J domain-containing protein [Dehalococcoidales bacterium]|nr:J domain-containing protein [Dehalococcoidales bacterium]